MKTRWQAVLLHLFVMLFAVNAQSIRTATITRKSDASGKNPAASNSLLYNEHMDILRQFADMIEPNAQDFEIMHVSGSKVQDLFKGKIPEGTTVLRGFPSARKNGTNNIMEIAMAVQTTPKPVKVAQKAQPSLPAQVSSSKAQPSLPAQVSSSKAQPSLPAQVRSSKAQPRSHVMHNLPAQQPTPLPVVPFRYMPIVPTATVVPPAYQTVLITPLEQLLRRPSANAFLHTFMGQDSVANSNPIISVLPAAHTVGNMVPLATQQLSNHHILPVLPIAEPPRREVIPVAMTTESARPLASTPAQMESPRHASPARDSDESENVIQESLQTFGSNDHQVPMTGYLTQNANSMSYYFNKLPVDLPVTHTEQSATRINHPVFRTTTPTPRTARDEAREVEALFESLRLQDIKVNRKPRVQSLIKSTQGALNNQANNEEPDWVLRPDELPLKDTIPSSSESHSLSAAEIQRDLEAQLAKFASLPFSSAGTTKHSLSSAPSSNFVLEPLTNVEPLPPPQTVPREVRGSKSITSSLHSLKDITKIRPPDPVELEFAFPPFTDARRKQRQKMPKLKFRPSPSFDDSNWIPITPRPTIKQANHIDYSNLPQTKHLFYLTPAEIPHNNPPTPTEAPTAEENIMSEPPSTNKHDERLENQLVKSTPVPGNQDSPRGNVLVVTPEPIHGKRLRKIKFLRSKKRRKSKILLQNAAKDSQTEMPMPVKYSVTSSVSIHVPEKNRLLKISSNSRARVRKNVISAILNERRGIRQRPRGRGGVQMRRTRRRQWEGWTLLQNLHNLSTWPKRQIKRVISAGRRVHKSYSSGVKSIKRKMDDFMLRGV